MQYGRETETRKASPGRRNGKPRREGETGRRAGKAKRKPGRRACNSKIGEYTRGLVVAVRFRDAIVAGAYYGCQLIFPSPLHSRTSAAGPLSRICTPPVFMRYDTDTMLLLNTENPVLYNNGSLSRKIRVRIIAFAQEAIMHIFSRKRGRK